MPAGRPSLYREEYCGGIVKFCADGLSIAAYAGHIDVARSTINEWVAEHPEFSEAVERAKAKRALWWDMRGVHLAENGGQGAQATMIIFGLKNHAPDDFRDKTEHEHSGPGGGPITQRIERVIVDPNGDARSTDTNGEDI